jgi:hypothetical protein
MYLAIVILSSLLHGIYFALDGHPNEIGHAVAAREIGGFLRENALLDVAAFSPGT